MYILISRKASSITWVAWESVLKENEFEGEFVSCVHVMAATRM